MSTPKKLFDKAFHPYRDPRSDEYKAGVMAILEYRLNGATPRNPYAPGTAQADAWSAGSNEGHAIYREWKSGE